MSGAAAAASVYAIDAEGGVPVPFWSVNVTNASAGMTTVPYINLGGGLGPIVPEVGITGTPVIGPKSGTLFVVAMTKENGSYVHKLHALDITNGKERYGSPVVIQASVAGTGSGSSGGEIAFQS